VNGVSDIRTGSGVALDLSHADEAESGRRRPHQARPSRTLPRAYRLGHEVAGLLTSIWTPGLEPTGSFLRGPLVYTVSVCGLDLV